MGTFEVVIAIVILTIILVAYMLYKKAKAVIGGALDAIDPLKIIKKSYGNGAGVTPSVCPQGTEKPPGELLCYPPCNAGYHRSGLLCLGSCPAGYDPEGDAASAVLCLRPADTKLIDRYQRNTAGRIPDKNPCPAGTRDDGTSCWEDLSCTTVDNGYYNYTWGCGTAIAPCWDNSWGCKDTCYRTWIASPSTTCSGCGCIVKTLFDRQTCAADEELITGLCYKKCNPGYTSGSGDILFCSNHAAKPDDYTDTGLTFYRPPDTVAVSSYGGGVGTAPTLCPPGTVRDPSGLLCYPPCAVGYHMVGPLCTEN